LIPSAPVRYAGLLSESRASADTPLTRSLHLSTQPSIISRDDKTEASQKY